MRPEFFAFLKQVSTEVAALHREGSMLEGKVWYQWDNAHIHSFDDADENNNALLKAGIDPCSVLEHPKYSCDFNRVVENAHGMIVNAFRDVLAKHPDVDDADGYKTLFRSMVEGRALRPGGEMAVPPSSCASNFDGLPKLWDAVIQAQGDYPHRHYMQ